MREFDIVTYVSAPIGLQFVFIGHDCRLGLIQTNNVTERKKFLLRGPSKMASPVNRRFRKGSLWRSDAVRLAATR
jgi:hypothetical protein